MSPTNWRNVSSGRTRTLFVAVMGFVLVSVLLTSTPGQAQTNADGCDYSAAGQNDGWGWNLDTRTACPPPSTTTRTAGCDYSDADKNDGWGWNPDTQTGCAPRSGGKPQQDQPVGSDGDPDGDTAVDDGCDYSAAHQNGGWGWNPTTNSSCPPVGSNDPGEPKEFQYLDLEISAADGNAYLRWTSLGSGYSYDVHVFQLVDGEVTTKSVTTGTPATKFTNATKGMFYMVTVDDGAVQAGSGLLNWESRCLEFCSAGEWQNPAIGSADRQAFAVPVLVGIVIREVVRRAAQRVIQYCARNPLDCAGRANDIAGAASQLDLLLGDNSGSTLVSQEVEDLQDGGYEVISTNDEANSIDVQRGNRIVSYTVYEGTGHQDAVVVRTETYLNSDGNPQTTIIEVRNTMRHPQGTDPVVVGDTTTSETTYYYRNGVLVGSFEERSENGVVKSTSCNGTADTTQCSSAAPQGDDDTTETTASDTTWTLGPLYPDTTVPDNYVTTIPASEPDTTEPDNYVTTASGGGADETSPPDTPSPSINRCLSGGGC